jgi:hypothetical protein
MSTRNLPLSTLRVSTACTGMDLPYHYLYERLLPKIIGKFGFSAIFIIKPGLRTDVNGLAHVYSINRS